MKGFVTQDRVKIWRGKYICMEGRLSDVLFFGSFHPPPPPPQKKKKKIARIMYLKNPDLDLI